MSTTAPSASASVPLDHAQGPLVQPFNLRLSEVAVMVNAELADHPVYDGFEIQRFDDAEHGSGLLAFLSRRDDRRVDYYVSPGLRLDREGYVIGGGTGAWVETPFERAILAVEADGVIADVRFTDVDGRSIEVRMDDRDGRPRRRGALLAPVSAGIDDPASLLLVWMPCFDLVRAVGDPPTVRIDGIDVGTGRLPGARLHRRHLVKYAAGLVSVEVNRHHDGPLPTTMAAEPWVPAITADGTDHRARLFFTPPVPDLRALADGAAATGRWHVVVDGVRLTGGTWSASRSGDEAEVGLEVDECWRPGRLPWLMRLVTRIMPVFRRWPTTYRWHADVHLGATPRMVSSWSRTSDEGAAGYRRVTRS